MQCGLLFSQSPVSGLSKTEQPLDDRKNMFHPGTNRGFRALYAPGMILTTLAELTNLGRPSIDAITNFPATLIEKHCIVALLRTAAATVAINVFLIARQTASALCSRH